MNEESSQARNRAARAISSACPGRPIGMWTSRRAAHCGSAISSAMSGVSIGPGHKTLARIPRRAYSTANSRVMARTPPLLAVYAICGTADPMSATSDDTFTIVPPPESIRAGIPYLQPSQTPLRFTAITRSHVESGVSRVPASSGGRMPALL